MSSITPALGVPSFSCPHCGALAAQNWFRLYASYCRDTEAPVPVIAQNTDQLSELALLISNRPGAFSSRETARQLRGLVYFGAIDLNNIKKNKVENLYIGQCFSCKDFSIWHNDALIYPSIIHTHEPHADMPLDIKSDFAEASSIVGKSPRGACALLRLCIQKLLSEFGYKGKRINDDIAKMVKEGIPNEIQQAFDIVRIIGNDAVHPGVIDLRDDVVIANKLFAIINYIVEEKIGKPKRIAEIYGSLPTGKIEEINKRDGKATGMSN
jgi:Domain of unknown function (DUF4145)